MRNVNPSVPSSGDSYIYDPRFQSLASFFADMTGVLSDSNFSLEKIVSDFIVKEPVSSELIFCYPVNEGGKNGEDSIGIISYKENRLLYTVYTNIKIGGQECSGPVRFCAYNEKTDYGDVVIMEIDIEFIPESVQPHSIISDLYSRFFHGDIKIDFFYSDKIKLFTVFNK